MKRRAPGWYIHFELVDEARVEHGPFPSKAVAGRTMAELEALITKAFMKGGRMPKDLARLIEARGVRSYLTHMPGKYVRGSWKTMVFEMHPSWVARSAKRKAKKSRKRSC